MKKNIFSYRLEIINLVLPFLFFILIYLEIFSGKSVLNNITHYQGAILSNIIFLNITHNAFTFVLLTSTLPLNVWIEKHGGERSFWREQAFILTSLTILFSALLYLGFNSRIVFLVFVLINFNFAAHHALSQTFGLSLLYNKSVSRSADLIKAEKDERLLFDIFLFSNLAAGTLYTLFNFGVFSLSINTMHTFRNFVCGWILFVGLCLVGHSFYFYKENKSKGFFNVRYLIWPITFLSPIAIFATTVLHGIEYGFVTDKMLRSDSFRKPKLGLAIVGIVILLAIVRLNSFEQIRVHQRVSPWLILITGLSVAISFLHYYLDRKLFKMRHQINRETVGVLLK